MRWGLIVILAALPGACGGPEFVGTFQGPISGTGSCSDGSALPSQDATVRVSLTESGNVTMWMAGCGATATAQVNGDTATVQPFTCPAITQNGVTRTTSVSGGTLIRNADSLVVNLTSSITVVSGSTNGTCSVTLAGVLARQN